MIRISIWAGVLCPLCLLIACSSPVFYQPRNYQPEQLKIFDSWPGASIIEYKTPEGMQSAFYLPQRSKPDGLPDKVWVIFSGIKSLALEWQPRLAKLSDKNIAFLLIDYPGYGLSKGVARAKRILLSSHTALAALADYLNVEQKIIEQRLCILGHSIGTGTALQFAVQVDVQKLVLISPFPDLRDLVVHRFGRMVGGFLNLINPEVYSNRERLDELATRFPPPEIIIFHGDKDDIIPIDMGRELAERHPSITVYHELKGAGHTDFISDYLDLIFGIRGNRVQYETK